jgi:hypothetical protein
LISPCYETPKNAIKNIEQKITEGERNQKRMEKTFFVMSPGDFSDFFPVSLNSPCYETPKKRGGGDQGENKTK